MDTVGFQTKLCKPKYPFTKGKVERWVRFVKNNFLAFRTFINIATLNLEVLDWCKRISNTTDQPQWFLKTCTVSITGRRYRSGLTTKWSPRTFIHWERTSLTSLSITEADDSVYHTGIVVLYARRIGKKSRFWSARKTYEVTRIKHDEAERIKRLGIYYLCIDDLPL